MKTEPTIEELRKAAKNHPNTFLAGALYVVDLYASQPMSAEQYSSGAIHSLGEFPAPAMSAKQVEDDAINSRFGNDKFIENVCLSFNNGFGLMAEQDKQALRFKCKEWMRAIKNNWKYHSTSPTVKADGWVSVEECKKIE